MPERQAFFPVEAIDQVFTDGQAFAIQEHPNLPVAVTRASSSQLGHSLTEGRVRIPMTLTPIRGLRLTEDLPEQAFRRALTIRRPQAEFLHHSDSL